MRCIVFGDESTIPGMLDVLGSNALLAVTASNRPSAAVSLQEHPVVSKPIAVQPPKTSLAYQDFLRRIHSLRPDYFFCFSYSMILPADLLAVPASGAINLHGGLLPEFRGAHIYNWVLIKDASETGMTAHFMTAGIDEGDIVLQQRVPINDADTAKTLKARVDPIGFEMLKHMRDEIGRNEALPRAPQNAARARYFRRRTPEDGRIDWSMSDREIFNMVRALVAPWPGAFFFDAKGKRVVLDRYLSMEEIRELRKRHG